MKKKDDFTFFNEEWNESPSDEEVQNEIDTYEEHKFKESQKEDEKKRLFSRMDIIGQNGNTGEHYGEGD
jgi:hypothetical protein